MAWRNMEEHRKTVARHAHTPRAGRCSTFAVAYPRQTPRNGPSASSLSYPPLSAAAYTAGTSALRTCLTAGWFYCVYERPHTRRLLPKSTESRPKYPWNFPDNRAQPGMRCGAARLLAATKRDGRRPLPCIG
eukprot:scaffold107488_cov30-Tisochrysis_lutea.AAC.1